MKKIIILLLTLVCIFSFSACSKQEKEIMFVAEYGQEFTLPYLGEGQYTLKDADGNIVELVSNTFVANDEQGYVLTFKKGIKKNKINIAVVDTTSPAIKTDYNFKTVTVGEKVSFPKAVAVDTKDGETTCSYSVMYNGQVVNANSDYFEVSGAGVFRVIIASTDNAGNKAEKTVYYDALSNNDGLTEVVASFSTPYGPEHIGNSKGFSPYYSTEIKYNGENGSLRMEMNGDQYLAPSFILNNFAKTDLSDSYGIAFRVYNDLGINISFAINWVESSFIYSLPVNEWTEIYISKDHFEDFANSPVEMFKEKFSINNINGMYFAFYAQDAEGLQKGLPRGNLYFSNICEVKKTSAEQLEKVIDNLDSDFTDSDLLTIENVLKVYDQLADSGKKTLQEKYNRLLSNYGDYLIGKYGSEKQEDVLIYFDSEVGMKQTTMGMISASIENNPFETGNKALKMITVDGSGGKFVMFDRVFNSNVTNYSKITFDIYVEDTNGYDIRLDYINDYTGTADRYIALTEGKNTITIDLNFTSLIGGFIQIYALDEISQNGVEKWEAFTEGITFYMTPIKGVN